MNVLLVTIIGYLVGLLVVKLCGTDLKHKRMEIVRCAIGDRMSLPVIFKCS